MYVVVNLLVFFIFILILLYFCFVLFFCLFFNIIFIVLFNISLIFIVLFIIYFIIVNFFSFYYLGTPGAAFKCLRSLRVISFNIIFINFLSCHVCMYFKYRERDRVDWLDGGSEGVRKILKMI